MREPVEGKSVPLQTSPMSSLVSYSSDIGSDSESSITKTVTQDNHINFNHSKNLDVCKKSNSKESCKSPSSTSDKIKYPGYSLNSHKKESVLKSRENEQNESSAIPLIESPKNTSGMNF
ncbi:hypothetical protein AVEN_128744-1 [Araneus ventricosus]|uniref:Uncharacterized protein n=1 Tax=Araneus ventricosus TaxID=182803 RepID=A0A4Y2WN02_ARAVE|nr:hypothetical protein AVEN_47388-1 [Araneus ventricosus]GBO38531.1 hypothetical protein AVEN_128744-1 [Araneus ventricosus]